MKIDDKYIIQFFVVNGRISSKKISHIDNYPEIKKYLENRYDYFNGKYASVINLIKNNYKEWPKCPICGKYLTKGNILNRHFCSNKCSNSSKETQEKAKKTFIKHYGVDHNFKSKEIRENIKKTNLKLYGTEYATQSEIIKQKTIQTNIKNYGVSYGFQNEEVKEKIKQTNIKNYGVENPFQAEECKEKAKQTKLEKYNDPNYHNIEKSKQTKLEKYNNPYYSNQDKAKQTKEEKYGDPNYNNREKAKQTMLKNLGVENPSQSKEIKDKKINTMRKNGTFNTSKPEDNCYKRLVKLFGAKDIFRNYNKDSRYQYMVDFYIKSLDLFIECNFHWTHGGHWFNKNSKEDLKTLRKWKNKAKNSSFYKNAIGTWTKKDIEKRKIARKNKLNYMVFWNENQLLKKFNI